MDGWMDVSESRAGPMPGSLGRRRRAPRVRPPAPGAEKRAAHARGRAPCSRAGAVGPPAMTSERRGGNVLAAFEGPKRPKRPATSERTQNVRAYAVSGHATGAAYGAF